MLLAGSAGGWFSSLTPSDADRAALQLESYNDYDYRPLYRVGNCFEPAGGVLDASCLALAAGKTNLLLWGDSLAAHYYHGLRAETDPQTTNILQATQAACMPTFNAATQGTAACRDFAAQMDGFFGYSQTRPRHPLRRLAGIFPPAAVRRHDRRPQADDRKAERIRHIRGAARPGRAVQVQAAVDADARASAAGRAASR